MNAFVDLSPILLIVVTNGPWSKFQKIHLIVSCFSEFSNDDRCLRGIFFSKERNAYGLIYPSFVLANIFILRAQTTKCWRHRSESSSCP